MSTDVSSSEPMLEDYISSRRAIGLMGISIATLDRYCTHGFHGIVLETRKIGRRRVTTQKWIAEFIAKVSEAHGASKVAAATDVVAVEEARERLRAAGILEDKR